MVKKEKACKQCGRITDLDVCIYCKTPTSLDWLGYVNILDPERSQVAQRLEINAKGRYALRVK